MRAIPVLILAFLGLSVLDFGPMYATDVRETDVRQIDVRRQTASSVNAPSIRGKHNKITLCCYMVGNYATLGRQKLLTQRNFR